MMTKKRIANPYWWGSADEDFAVDPNEVIPVQDILDVFDEMIDIQFDSYNVDPYMHGLYNGMLFMKSMIDGKGPLYLEAPEIWLADLPDDGIPPTECFDFNEQQYCQEKIRDVRTEMPAPVLPEGCYIDEMGNEVCEGEPRVEEPSMALVPFEEAAEEDVLEADDGKVYFATNMAAATAAARSRGLNFVYLKADEPWRPPRKGSDVEDPYGGPDWPEWDEEKNSRLRGRTRSNKERPRGRNLYYPDPRREGVEEGDEPTGRNPDCPNYGLPRKHRRRKGRPPFKKERRRKEDHPVIVDTCGRNYTPEECREDYEKGFNALAQALAPFVRLAVVPHEELEDAEWRVVDTCSDPMTDVGFYGTGPYENIQEREYFSGWEGEGTLEIVIGSGITYNIDLDWSLAPDAKGPEDVELQVWVKGGPEHLKLEMRDGSVMTAKEYFTTYVPSLIWEYDLAGELFPPPGEPEYEDPRIPAM